MKKSDQSSLQAPAYSAPVCCRYVAGVVISSQEFAPADSSNPVAPRDTGDEFTFSSSVLPLLRFPASVFRLSCVQLNFWAPPPS